MLTGCPWMLALLALLAGPASQPAAGPAIDAQADLKIVQDVYGAQIQAAKATPAVDDDLALAKQLMTAGEDVSSTPGLRMALGKTVLDLAGPVGTEAAVQLAQQAVKAIESVQPLPPLQKVTVKRDLAMARFNRGIAERRRPAEMQSLALSAVEAYAELIDALRLDSDRIGEIDAAVSAARPLVFRYQLRNLTNACETIEAVHKWFLARKQAFQAGEARLAAALKSEDEKTIVQAHLAMADLCLQQDGDLKGAARHLIKTDDPRKPPVLAAAAFLVNPKDPAGTPKIETVEGLLAIAQALAGEAQKRVADVGLQVCQAYLGDMAAESMPTKPRLLMMQLEKLSGQTADARLAKKLADGYGSFTAKLQMLEKQQVRCTYDFGTARQLDDFSGDASAWLARLDVLGIKTAKASALNNKLRFYANQPMKVQVKAQGTQHLVLRLTFNVYGETVGTYTYKFIHCTPNTTSTYRPITSYIERPRGEGIGADLRKTFRHRSDNAYLMKVTWDGTQFIWSVKHGASEEVSRTLAVPLADPDVTFLQVGLETMNSTSYFDDLVIEGKVVDDPQHVLVKREPPAEGEEGGKHKHKHDIGAAEVGTRKPAEGEKPPKHKPIEEDAPAPKKPDPAAKDDQPAKADEVKKPALPPKKVTVEDLLKPSEGDENLRPPKHEKDPPVGGDDAPMPAPKDDEAKPAPKGEAAKPAPKDDQARPAGKE